MDYYILDIVLDSKVYYTIWFTDVKDGFITELGKVKTFTDVKELIEYAKTNNIELKNERTTYDFDKAIKWLKEKDEVDCNYIFDCWNLFGDISNSINVRFYGNKRIKHVNKIYDKLFFGINLEVFREYGEYNPVWEKIEYKIIKRIIRDGIRIVKTYLI